MCKKLTTNEWIERAIEVHNNKYDYSKVDYKKAIIKVIIICKKHGEFKQQANLHLNGAGCYKCSGKYQPTTKEWIENAIKVRGNKYNYSKVEYTSSKNKVIIICNEHGEFYILPLNFINGQNCNICSNRKKLTSQEFVYKAKLIHNNKYDYSKTNYNGMHKKIIIICHKHGEFEQKSCDHIHSKKGCAKCSGNYKPTTLEFIENVIKVHGNKYEYSKVNYINSIEKVIIICKKHGKFKQTPNSHLVGASCPKCTNNKFSKAQIQWLCILSKVNNIYIQHAMNDGEFKLPIFGYKVDGYCYETNTIYEYHGDYWHGNPTLYKSEEINKICKKTHGELYQKTLEKEQKIKELGYNLVVMWESDWIRKNKIHNIIKKNQTLEL
jgi:ribosomal protein L36